MIPMEEVFLKPEDIILPKDYLPDAQRLEEMIISIKEKGRLLHTPIVKDNKEIIAGRLRVAASRGHLDLIKCLSVPNDLPEDEYKALSLHENLMRHNLPWYEIVAEEKELHELRRRQSDEENRGQRGKKSTWGLRETAAELNISLGALSEDLRLADAILADPSLKRIQDKTTARKVIFENIKRARQELGAMAPTSVDINVCHHGYSDAVLNLYPDNFFDCCLTDPPWLEFKDPTLTRDEFTLPVFKQVYRVLKQNAFLYAFVSTQDWYYYQEKLVELGFSVQKWPLIWSKEGVLTYGRKSWEYQRDYEPIILAVKGSPAVCDSMLSSVITCKVVPSAKLIHPNEKPEQVIKVLLEHSTFDGSLVLDPFGGSGVVAYTSKKMGRRYVTIERDLNYYSKMVGRLK